METYTVCAVRRQELEALPAAKITDYPLEKRDYRPFAQAILCQNADKLILRMWAFEVSPPAGSEICAVLYLFAQPEIALHVRFCLEEGSDAPVCAVRLAEAGASDSVAFGDFVFRSRAGEDLQGIFWGGEAEIPRTVFADQGLTALLAPGDSFPGNFYKICPDGPRRHFGSFSPADWAQPYAPGNMGRCVVAGY